MVLPLPLQHVPKQTGAAFGAYVGFLATAFQWTAGEATLYRSSDAVDRGFCARCGSTLTFHRARETSLALGSLDRPEKIEVGAPRPEYQDCHIWIEDQLPWLNIDDCLDRFPRFPSGRSKDSPGG